MNRVNLILANSFYYVQVIAEDLITPIPKKNNWRQPINESVDQKGSITEALETVVKARGSRLHYVKAAYTSQMDSNTHLLQRNRVGDQELRWFLFLVPNLRLGIPSSTLCIERLVFLVPNLRLGMPASTLCVIQL